LSHLQLPQGAPSTTSQRTLRALQETQARAARLLVTFWPALESEAVEVVRFFFCCDDDEVDAAFVATEDGAVEEVGEDESCGAKAVGVGERDTERSSVS